MLVVAIGKAVGLLALLHLSVKCRCHYIRNGHSEPRGSRSGSPSQRTVQICGSKLTSFITALCDGYFASPNEESEEAFNYAPKAPSLDRNGVVEKCCKNPCDRDFLLQHCNESRSNLTTMFGGARDVGKGTNELADRVKEMRLLKMRAEATRTKNATEDPGTGGNEIEKRHNMFVQPIEVGTITPINLGGDPVVVPSRHRSANYHRG